MSLRFNILKRFFGVVVLTICVFGLSQLLMINSTQAVSGALDENQCHCYCKGEFGASYAGKATVKAATPDEQKNTCKGLCKYVGRPVSVCSETMATNPVNNPTCFTESQCTKSKSSGGYDGVWDGKPAEDCLNDYRKCYAKTNNNKIWLNIPILQVKQVKDVSKYVRVVYEWMVKSGIIISVVLIMVGGMQYAFGAITPEQISKAKKRIINSVIGIVLLLGSYLLLFTINPQLLNLKVPSLPLIKTIILPENQSCSEYKKKGYEINPKTPGKCGDTSALIKDPSGNNAASGSLCNWTECDDADERCAHTDGKSQCLKCEDITEGNSLGITPSANLCNSLSRNTEGRKQEVCIWTKDSKLNTSTIEIGNMHGACAMMNLDCSLVSSCDQYDNKVTLSNGYAQNVELDQLESTMAIFGNMSLSKICLEDPCGIERKLGVTCYMDASDACDTKGTPRKSANWDRRCDACEKCGEGAFELCDADDEDECPQRYCDNKGGDSDCIPRDCCNAGSGC
jgi:hypothetical protein